LYFERSPEQKLKHTLSDAEVNQGYTPDGAEANGGTDHKEVAHLRSETASWKSVLTTISQCYEHRRFKNDLCPNNDELTDFKKVMDNFYEVS
jgi:hypothetical protein